MINLAELVALLLVIYIIYNIINKNKKKDISNKNSYEILKYIYENCDGPWDDVTIDEELYNQMKSLYGDKTIKKIKL